MSQSFEQPSNITDNDELADPSDNRMKDVGTIRVEIKLVRLGDEVPFEGYDVTDNELVHERAKKAGAHCTKCVTISNLGYALLDHMIDLVKRGKQMAHELLLCRRHPTIRTNPGLMWFSSFGTGV